MKLRNKISKLQVVLISFDRRESSELLTLLNQHVWKDYLLEIVYHTYDEAAPLYAYSGRVNILICNELNDDTCEIIKHMKVNNPWLAVYVFLSDHTQIQNAFSLRVEQVFRKPLEIQNFMNRFQESFQSLWIYLNYYQICNIKEIMYIEYAQRRSCVYFNEGYIESSRSLNDWMDLLAYRGFVRINRYTIVNLNCVTMKGNAVRLENGKTFVFSERYQTLLKNKIDLIDGCEG